MILGVVNIKARKRNNIMSISLEKNDFESPSTA